MTTQILGYIADPNAEEKERQERIKRMEKAMYFIKQRIMGIIAIIVGIVALFATSEGVIASVLLIPYGIAMIVSKEKMITETEKDINEEEHHKSTV